MEGEPSAEAQKEREEYVAAHEAWVRRSAAEDAAEAIAGPRETAYAKEWVAQNLGAVVARVNATPATTLTNAQRARCAANRFRATAQKCVDIPPSMLSPIAARAKPHRVISPLMEALRAFGITVYSIWTHDFDGGEGIRILVLQ
jgi:hypothetical protein